MKIDPDRQFLPTVDSIGAALDDYGLKLVSFELAKSGIENCTVFVETDKGPYVLRVYRQAKKTLRAIQLEVSFVNYLNRHGIPVAEPIANQAGSPITKVTVKNKVWQAILMPLMRGEHSEEYSDRLISSLAALQAKMHLLAMEFTQTDNSADSLQELHEGYFIKLINDRNALDAARAGFVDRAEAYVVSIDNKLPSGLCHLDYDNGNVLSLNDQVTAVLDFDDLAYAPYVMCLAYTVWDVAFDKGMQALQKYLAEYMKLRQLNEDEQNILVPIVLFRHYVIGCKDIADGQMTNNLLDKYLSLEQMFLVRIKS